MTKQGRYKQSGEQSKKHVHVSENGHTGNKSGCPISKKCRSEEHTSELQSR